jgi:flagellar hook assembly protein FlgD
MGNLVRSLVDDNQEAGFKSIEWNSTNDAGNMVASGVYFYRITATSVTEAKTFVDTKKMMLVK